MKSKVLLILLFLFASKNLQSQNIDSLLVVAQTAKNDSVSVTLHNLASYHLIFSDSKRAAKTLKVGKARALKSKFYYGYIELTNTEGVYYDVNGNKDSAGYCFKKALALSKKNRFLNLETRTTNNLGMLNWNLGKFNEALAFFFKALKLNEKLPQDKKVAESTMYSNIGLIYQEMNLFEKALSYHKKAYDFRKKTNRVIEIPVSLNNIGICYERLHKSDLATEAYREGIKAAKAAQNITEYYRIIENYSGILAGKGRNKEAINYLLESLNRPPEVPMSNKTRISLYSALTVSYNNLGQAATALAYGLKGLEVLHQNPDLQNYSGDLYMGLAHSYYMLGDTENGLKYSVKFGESTRERFSTDNAEEMADLEVKFETEKKEKLIAENKVDMVKMEAEAKQKNYMIMAAVFFIAFLSAIGYLLYRQQRLKNKQLEKEFELKSALAQIENQNRLQEQRLTISRDLHDNIGAQLTFIISTLDSLKYRLHESSPTVGNKLEGISNFTRQTIIELRDTIWAMNTKHITFEDLRVRILNFVEKAQEANEDIVFDFKIDPVLMELELSSVTGMNVYRTIQEAINNTIKHSDATRMEIIVFDDSNAVSIIMRDNGKGFDRDTIAPGNGLQNMEKRIEDIGGTLNYTSSLNDGTLIKIHLPKKMQSA